ncbi:mandelate racemase/muconate lactonizing enzyme family protein [Acetonema longum]|uniref:Mandelate racemase/muconate lactonizing protein n=1 Tax=Acetonema longum DSM 6540 TaxID=1009370 RepID=F7NLW0_9FIRM|nr:mandelate racemase/muconate lactonizing enzyme family protein [Acetonema longum]EGO62970.1 Mandelate racemase/muconate lactonizing protein [Acetonema longum DSM 6540]
MKIIDVKTVPVNRFLFVEIHTDEGITGIGESGAWGFLDASLEAVNSFKTYLIGQDPLRIEHHWQYMYRCFHFRGAAIMGALSAIDIALWDIAGKYFNTPVYNLLGGKCRDKARVYYHVGGTTIEEMLANLKEAKAKGFTAVGHLSPFLDEDRSAPYFETHAQKIGNAIERVRLYREAVGDEVDLCVEIHRRLRPAEAIALARGIEKYHPFFYEDPTTPDNFDSMEFIAGHTDIPIATGERFHTPQEFAQIIRRNAATYLRPDVCLCGGITGAKKIAALAEASDLMIVPHNPLSPVSTAACTQIAACIPNFALQEFPGDDRPAATERYIGHNIEHKESQFRQGEVVKKTFRVENGFLIIPETPGIGVELADNVAERFPYSRRPIQTRLHIDGSVIDQ